MKASRDSNDGLTSHIDKKTTDIQSSLYKMYPQNWYSRQSSSDIRVSEEEVLCAIYSLQNNKVQRPEGFLIKYFIAFSKKLLAPLTNMIKEALDNHVLPYSLEVSTITLLPKLVKDKQKCGSYRPLSLLNSDYKVLSKIIALRLENVMQIKPRFVKNRQGADNVHRLFHIIKAAQKWGRPMVIVSMNAEKAFDRIEPSFLLHTVRPMIFFFTFIQYIKISLMPIRLRFWLTEFCRAPSPALGSKSGHFWHYVLLLIYQDISR